MKPAIILALLLGGPATPVDLAQVECTANVIYVEARSETLADQVRVASAVLNRGVPCDVVSRRGQFAAPIRHDEPEAWTTAVWVAILVHRGALPRSRATHFHDKSVRPYWTKGMTLVASSSRMKFWVKA